MADAPIRYLSVCSGIEAATQAWQPLGWQPVAFSEIEKFPSAVLAHRYPNVPNWGDMTKFREWPDADVDVLVGGTPCQSFSVAGLRQGLADPRGNLMLTYLAIADRYRPRWIVWENVPGVLSSNDGRDFGAFLGGLGQLGYGFAYRILDAQFCRTLRFPRAVPQRRRRVFVIGYLGDWRPAAAVLFDRESLRGDPAPRREAGQSAAKCLTRGANQRIDFETEDFITTPIAFGANMSLQNPDDSGVHPTITRRTHAAVAFDMRGREGGAMPEGPHDTANIRAASGGSSRSYVAQPWAVRRLTPAECEALQGFPSGFTRIPYRKKPAELCPDGPRYKSLGNSMAIPCMEWIGLRINLVRATLQEKNHG